MKNISLNTVKHFLQSGEIRYYTDYRKARFFEIIFRKYWFMQFLYGYR
jgi:hypothetical protein